MTHHAQTSVGFGLPSFDPLTPYGWSTARSEAFHAVAPPGCEPGRIVAATRGFVLAQTASGECWGMPTGRLRERLQRDGLSLCAGDWIILQPNPGPSKASVIHLLPRSASLMRQGTGIGSRPQCLAANLNVVLLVMGLDRNFNPARMRRAQAALAKRGLPLAVNQMRYSLLSREIETNGVLETAKELGMTITAYTPLGRGLLSGKYHKNPELLNRMKGVRKAMMQRNLERSRPLINVMDEMAARYGVTIAQVALNWVINFNGETVVTIPGATKVRQAEEAAGAMKFQLTKDEMARLDELSRSLS